MKSLTHLPRPMRTIIILLITCFGFTAYTQSIKGTVKDSQNELLTGASVSLLSLVDSSLITGEVTDNSGKFQFRNILPGSYFLKISFIGLQTYISSPLHIKSNDAHLILPVIVLQVEAGLQLNELVIVAKRPLIEQDIDRTIVNVDAMLTSATSNTLEVLEKSPGVTIGSNGEISLNGKNGVLVLIDGRATHMSGQDLAAYLKSLPGSVLDKIELMDNPPAKYDASGGAIINIRLKRNKTIGFTGNLSASMSQGSRTRTYEALNLNLNNRKFNWFGNLGFNTEDNYVTDQYTRKLFSSPQVLNSILNIDNQYRYSTQGLVGRAGFDFIATPKTTYGFQLNIQTRPKNDFTENLSMGSGQDLDIDSTGLSHISGDYRWKNLGLNTNFTHKINDKGRELSADINYLSYQSTREQNFTNRIHIPVSSTQYEQTFKYDILSGIDIYNMRLDYVHPLKNKMSFEAGIKTSLVINDNDSRYFNQVGQVEELDYNQSNHFIFDENINAAYFSGRKSWKRWASQLGLRLENTRLKGDQRGNDQQAGSDFSRSLTGLFPTAFLSYKLDSLGNNTLSASMGRRINRPNYQEFNPFRVFRDQYSYHTGNPQLNPIYYDRVEMRFQHKQRFGFGVQLNRAIGLILVKNVIENNIITTFPENLSRGHLIMFLSNFSLNPFKWWTMRVNLAHGRMHLKGQLGYTPYEQLGSSTRMNIMNQFNFSKKWSAELNANGSTKDFSGQYIVRPRGRVYLGIQKKILKEKGSLKLTIEDLFHSQISSEDLVGVPLIEGYHYNESDTQRIGLAFTYRFGQEDKGRSRRGREGADEEKGRVE